MADTIPPCPPTIAAARADQAWRAGAVSPPALGEYHESRIAQCWLLQRMLAAGCPEPDALRLMERVPMAIFTALSRRWREEAVLTLPQVEDTIWGAVEKIARVLPGVMGVQDDD